MTPIYAIMQDILYYRHKLEFARYVRLHTQSDDRSKIDFWEKRIIEKERELFSELAHKYG